MLQFNKLENGGKVLEYPALQASKDYRQVLDLLHYGSTVITASDREDFKFELRAPEGVAVMQCYRITAKLHGVYAGQVDTSVWREDHPFGSQAKGWGLIDYRFGLQIEEGREPYFRRIHGTGTPAIEVSREIQSSYSGVGRALIGFAAGIAQELGADIVIADSVFESKVVFYEKIGFEQRLGRLDNKMRSVLCLDLSHLERNSDLEITKRAL